MTNGSGFAGGDQPYLRNVQYRDGSNLDARTALHQRFSSSSVSFPDFAAGLIHWGEGVEVLECGTGTGRFWDNGLVPRSTRLTLTDLSPGMLEAAVPRATENGFDQVQSQECDVQDLPFGDASFDVVVANHMLYHVPQPDRAVSELARVLRRDGMLLAATNGYGHMGEMNAAVAEAFGHHSESLYEVFGIDSGEARLRTQFASISWHAYDNDLLVTDQDAAVAYGLSFPPGDSATEPQKAEFAAAIGRRFADGQLRIRTRSGAFVATKKRVSAANA